MANANIVPPGLFGPGILILTRQDVANATPFNVGFVQEFSYTIKGSPKSLFGQNQYALVSAVGTKTATAKCKAAVPSGQLLNQFLNGGTITLGTQTGMTSSPATAIPATPFQITPTVPSSGTFDADLGVVNAANNEPLILVTGTPAAGEYAHTAGLYTFSSADNVSGISVIISYAYTWTTAPGMSFTVPNAPIGTTPVFQLDYQTVLYGSAYYIRFYAAICSNIQVGHKLDDFAPPEYDFELFVNASQNLMKMSFGSQA